MTHPSPAPDHLPGTGTPAPPDAPSAPAAPSDAAAPAPSGTDRGTPAPTGRWGLLLGAGAFFLWGAMPLYFPLLEPAAPLEIIAHRVVWSLLFCLVLLAATRQLGGFVAALRSPRTLGTLAVAAVLIVTNWTVYVYGVLSGHVLDAALGYFINPLVTVLLAVAVLRERLRPAQWVAVGVGAAAVVVISTGAGGLPWIALVLAGSFGLYGLVKNRVGRTVEALPGLAVETAVLTPVALVYLGWLGATGAGTFGTEGVGHALLLASAGIVTALPLLLFSAAARRLPLSVVGLLQYLGPALQFLFGLLVFHEPMSPTRWAGFGLVWLALVVLSVDGLRTARATRLAARR
ncbi:MAG: EamA family transporter RarD [Cellulosimicrobium funkei]|uniref:EamA family transporter RarD n=1 Tax=Cellulosimicrobium cellulans TaxID=1710 RepID=A0AAV5P1V2_CELCE|nr:EamA family transporter RarD [Cellulosimicrobium cellulans]QDP74953.1 EamA family transporter RarD [Cellulosimicrobium cellulans]GLY56264.1 protein RarD [Cellulosimicrobium cellulans]